MNTHVGDIKDKLNNVASTGKQSVSGQKSIVKKGRKYDVTPVSISERSATNAALKELSVLQNNLMTDYREWAKEEVKYNDLDASCANLKQISDDYTMQMLMNCINSFQNGITFGSLLSTMMSYKMASTADPQFEQSVSRLFLNIRESMGSQIEERYAHQGKVGKLLELPAHSLFSKVSDDYLTTKSARGTHNAINYALRSNTLDDLVMTPRQVAALKVNFMEQYYVDLRKYNNGDSSFDSDYARCKRDYEIAMKHLENISASSGFDMSVVAEEERYIVGLKMLENPKYATIFNETFDLDGAVPVVDSNGSWSGEFKTRDGHEYNIGNINDLKQGSFTVRQPFGYGSEDYLQMAETKFKNNVEKATKAYLDMLFTADKLVEDSSVNSSYVKVALDEYYSEYKDRIINAMCDDTGMSKLACTDLFNKTAKPIKDNFDEMKQSVGSKAYAASSLIVNESNYIVDRTICQSLGINMYPCTMERDENGQVVPYQKGVKATLLKEFGKVLTEKNHDVHPNDTRSAAELLETARLEYLSSMSAQDISNLLIRAQANTAQGGRQGRRGSTRCYLDFQDLAILNDCTYRQTHTGIDVKDVSVNKENEYGS